MRRLAQELGAGAASLYWHVGDKEELLSLLLDRIVGEAEVPRARPGELAGLGQGARPRRPPAPDHAPRRRAALARPRARGPELAARSSSATWPCWRPPALPPRVIAYAADMFALYVGAFAYEESLHGARAGGAGRSSATTSRSLPARGLPDAHAARRRPHRRRRRRSASSSRSSCSSAAWRRWAQLSEAVRTGCEVGVRRAAERLGVDQHGLDAVEVAGHRRRRRAVAARREERRGRLDRASSRWIQTM